MARHVRVTPRRLSIWALVATGAWTAESAVYAVQVQLSAAQSGHPVPFGSSLVQSLVSALLWVPFTVLALWLAFRWPVTATPRFWLVHLAGFLVLVTGRAGAVLVFNDAVGWYPAGAPPWPELMVAGALNNLVTYVLMTGLAHAVFYHQAARETETRFAAARLGALTSQLQPHFLFNALNTIAAMIPSRPDAAERMVVDLATLLRFSVDRDSSALVTLEEELVIGRAYLKIEEHRFADRLRVVVTVDPEVRTVALPPFLLQPLLENAVLHGLASRQGQSTLEISAARVDDEVHIVISDDGVGLRDTRTEPGGLGLRNVRERLQQTFGEHARLELGSRHPNGTAAVVVVPFRSAAAVGSGH